MRETREKCGVFAIYDYQGNADNLALDAYQGGLELEHRGQHGWGLGYVEENKKQNRFRIEHRLGPIGCIGNELNDFMDVGRIRAAFCQTLYHTSGKHEKKQQKKKKKTKRFDKRYAQPMESPDGSLAMLWNGNLSNFSQLKKEDEVVDTQTLLRLVIEGMRKSEKTALAEIMGEAFEHVDARAEGAFNIVVVHKGDPQRDLPPAIFAHRDKWGTRPMGYTIDDQKRLLIYSENVASPSPDAKRHNVPPGAMVHSMDLYPEPIHITPADPHHCFFEWIYFASVSSQFDGANVRESRNLAGAILARQDREQFGPHIPDMVIAPVPESARAGTSGFSDELNMFPNGNAITRNTAYRGRAFIEQTKKGKKHIVNVDEVENKSVIVVGDSLVRGKTIKKLIKDLKKAGAKEIHLRFCCPPILGICAKGIDIRTIKELFVPKVFDYNVPEFNDEGSLPEWALQKIAEVLEVDSVRFLPIPGVAEALQKETSDLCISCVHGKGECYGTDSEKALVELSLDEARKGKKKAKKKKKK